MVPTSLEIAKGFLGREVEIIVDRPLATLHPEFGFVYEVNYGYIEGAKAPDGENLDAYFLGSDKPLRKAKGRVIAIVHRLNDDDDKLVVVANGFDPENDKIKKFVDFQERWFDYEIVRI